METPVCYWSWIYLLAVVGWDKASWMLGVIVATPIWNCRCYSHIKLLELLSSEISCSLNVGLIATNTYDLWTPCRLLFYKSNHALQSAQSQLRLYSSTCDFRPNSVKIYWCAYTKVLLGRLPEERATVYEFWLFWCLDQLFLYTSKHAYSTYVPTVITF